MGAIVTNPIPVIFILHIGFDFRLSPGMFVRHVQFTKGLFPLGGCAVSTSIFNSSIGKVGFLSFVFCYTLM